MKKILILSIFLYICTASFSYALDVRTHRTINEYIAQNNLGGFSLDTYLKNQLGMQNGMKEQFNSKEVWNLFSDGGEYEDKPRWFPPYLRSTNHFHNPLAPTLNAAGFNGIWDTYFLAGLSAIWWSQLRIGTQTIEVPFSGNYSWFDTRDYFYRALTSSGLTTRNKNFAETFRGLGQLMHLVQDMSVPEHARNDGHSTYAYEEYVRDHSALVTSATIQPIFFNTTALSQPSVFGIQAPVPIANLFDTNQYSGANPAVTVSQNMGLAEYTNANFVSPDTLFKNYPYPSKDTSVTIVDFAIPDPLNPGTTVPRPYYKKTSDGDTGYRLAGVNYFWFRGQAYGIGDDPGMPTPIRRGLPIMDQYVYGDYAQKLLPRAVGYSAGLLDYFFRGYISVIPDGDSVSQFAIANNGKEDMTGTFSLYYDDKDNNRVLITSWENLAVDAESQSSTVTFNVPSNPPPKEKDKYILVFKGKMGNETGAVAGKIVKWWREEWDSEKLTGNHTWLTTDSELLRQNPANGEAHNDVISGKLTKENIRYAGHYTPRVNQTIIQDAYEQPWGGSTQYCLDEESSAYCVPFDFGTEFPMPITKDTVVRVKIDEMSINENIPYQECGPTYGGPGGYQGIILRFDNGVDFAFTVPDQVPFNMKLVSYITPAVETSFNISDAFKSVNMEFTEPVNLVSVNIVQQLWLLCASSTTEHRQRMVVDYIRFQER